MTDCFYLIGRKQNTLALIRCRSLRSTTVKARRIKSRLLQRSHYEIHNHEGTARTRFISTIVITEINYTFEIFSHNFFVNTEIAK